MILGPSVVVGPAVEVEGWMRAWIWQTNMYIRIIANIRITTSAIIQPGLVELVGKVDHVFESSLHGQVNVGIGSAFWEPWHSVLIGCVGKHRERSAETIVPMLPADNHPVQLLAKV